MSPIRLGAVGFLNARPLVYGLERSQRFVIRYDVPSRCSALLHEGAIDIGLIPSIEYLRPPAGSPGYMIVPDLAIASTGPVESVALYTRKPIDAVRAIALDTSSRTSAALLKVFCRRVFHITPSFVDSPPDLARMLGAADAALMIGDRALVLDHAAAVEAVGVASIGKIDLGAEWTRLTGLPFVYAVWAGRAGVASPADVRDLQEARDAGVAHADEVAAEYFRAEPQHIAAGQRYLRDNIKYTLGPEERAGLELFFQFAAEAGMVSGAEPLRFYEHEPAPAAGVTIR
jgi:chorismate dehydratase